MADDAPTQDLSEETQPPEAQPDGLTVLAEDPERDPAEDDGDQPQAEGVDGAEPESRMILETTVERAEYMPLFVAPQPVEPSDSGSDDDYDDTDDGGPDSDEEQAERPSRRRRRGRRGRGRGRGEQGGDDAGDDVRRRPGRGLRRRVRRRQRRRRNERRQTAPPVAAVGAGGASPASGDDNDGSPDDPPNTVVHERAGRNRQGTTTTTRFRASPARPGWRPSASAAATAATRDGAARRS